MNDLSHMWAEDIRAVAAHKDAAAFSRLFGTFAPKVKGFLILQRVSPQRAEELAAEVMIAVWLRAETYDPGKASPAAWIYAIARNRGIDEFRRERHPSELASRYEAAAPAQTPEDALCAEERHVMMHRAIARLPADHRDVLLLSYFQERPHSDIADALGLPLGTVKSRLRLALARLRRMLSETE